MDPHICTLITISLGWVFPNVSLYYANGVTTPRISKPDNPKYLTNSIISLKNIKSISKYNTKYNFVCKE